MMRILGTDQGGGGWWWKEAAEPQIQRVPGQSPGTREKAGINLFRAFYIHLLGSQVRFPYSPE
jgi:hypothetical protein